MDYQIYKYVIYALFFTLIFEQLVISLGRKKRNVNHMLLCALVIITIGGYMVMMNARNAEVAIEANRITYLGGCLLPIVVLKIGAELCNINMKTRVYAALSALAIVVLAMAWSSGYLDYYYSDYWIEDVDGITVLHKTYGPWHAFYYLYLFIYFIVAVIVIVNGVRNRRKYSNRLVITYTVIWGLVYFTYFGERLLNLPIKLMPIALSIGMTFFVLLFRRANLLSMNTNLINIEERERENGYIVVSIWNRITAYNKKALDMFPELKNVEIDTSISMIEHTRFYNEIFLPLVNSEDQRLERVEFNGNHLRVRLNRINATAQFGDRGWVLEAFDVREEVKYYEMLKNYRTRLEAEVYEKTGNLESIRQTIVTGMAGMIESRDTSTGGHIRRTSDVVRIFSEGLIGSGYPLGRAFLHKVVIAAPLHDLGKIAVADAVLRKKGKYTPEEYEIMKTHASKGAVIVRRVFSGMNDEELVNIVANVAQYHHEKWNGQGYPMGLKGEEIPVEARIMALADVFDALVSKRYYKEAYSYDEAFRIIEESIGTHFDPELGKAFLTVRPQLEALYNKYEAEIAEEAKEDNI